MRDWYAGLSPRARHFTPVLLAVCLLTLPLYIIGFSRIDARSEPSLSEPQAAVATEATPDFDAEAFEPTEIALPSLTVRPPAATAVPQAPVRFVAPPPPPPHAEPPGHDRDEKDKNKANHGRNEGDHGPRGGR